MKVRTFFRLLPLFLAAAVFSAGGANWAQDLLDALLADHAAFQEVEKDFERRQAAGDLSAEELAEYREFVDYLRGRVRSGCGALEQAGLTDVPEELPCEFSRATPAESAAAGLPLPRIPSAAQQQSAGTGPAAGEGTAADKTSVNRSRAGAGEAAADDAGQAGSPVTGASDPKAAGDRDASRAASGKSRTSGDRSGGFGSSSAGELIAGEDPAGRMGDQAGAGRSPVGGREAVRRGGGQAANGRWVSAGARQSGEDGGRERPENGPDAAGDANTRGFGRRELQAEGQGAGGGDGPSGRGSTSEQAATAAEVSELDARFQQSLSRFDGLLLKEQDRVKAEAPLGAVDRDGFGAGRPGELTEQETQSPGGGATVTGSTDSGQAYGGRGQGGGGSGGRLGRTSTLPASRAGPVRQDESIVARQIREAAEAETDPELKAKLWEEYRKLRSGRYPGEGGAP